MLNVQSVSVKNSPSVTFGRRLTPEELERKKYEDERKFYESQQRELRSISRDSAAGPIGKVAKILLRITGAVLAGVGMALASNMSLNILGKMCKHVKLDKAAKWTGKKMGSGFKFVGKQFAKLGKWAKDTSLAKSIVKKSHNLAEKYNKTSFAKSLSKQTKNIKSKQAYINAAERLANFEEKAINKVFGITGKDVKTAVANTLGIASGLTVLVNANNRGKS